MPSGPIAGENARAALLISLGLFIKPTEQINKEILFFPACDLYYSTHARIRKLDHKSDRYRLGYLRMFFGDIPVSDIDQKRLAELIIWLMDVRKCAKPTINRYLALVGVMWHKLRDMGYHVQNLIIEKFPEDDHPELYSETEIQKMSNSDILKNPEYDHVYRFLHFGYHYGMRTKEILTLKYSMINFETNTITLLRKLTKSQKKRLLPITDESRPVLMEWARTAKSEFVVTYKGHPLKDLRRAWKHLLSAEGLTGKRTKHMLRHSMATHLLMKGSDLKSVQDLLGHSHSWVTEKYVTIASDFLRSQLNRLHLPDHSEHTICKPFQNDSAVDHIGFSLPGSNTMPVSNSRTTPVDAIPPIVP